MALAAAGCGDGNGNDDTSAAGPAEVSAGGEPAGTGPAVGSGSTASGSESAASGSGSAADGGDSGDGGPAADQPPGRADNSAWRERGEPSDADRSAAEAAAGRIRPELERLRGAGDFEVDSVQAALVGLGFSARQVTVQSLAERTSLLSPPPVGVAYAVEIGQTACVTGDVSPSEARAMVTGRAAEFGCLEPFAH